VEVQLPFLQKVQSGVPVIPVIFGDADPQEAAKVMASRMDDHTFLIVSSDLSHFHTYEDAKRRDGECVKFICDLDIARTTRAEACGKQPILALMHLAKAKGWKTRLLDARNSGDTVGTRDFVVGYAAIAFYEPEHKTETVKHALVLGEPPMYTAEERDFLLHLARKTLVSVTAGGSLPSLETASLTSRLKEKRACFVTLTKDGQLRGCIGHIQAQESLVDSVIHNARSAALDDSRFSPVRSSEVPKLTIEISVLSPLQPLSFSSPEDLLKKLRPRVDGVLIKLGYKQAVFLPQVWEELPDKQAFLSHLSQKAGGSADMWKQKGLEVWTYQVEAFKEK
jgi:hypothetical protein